MTICELCGAEVKIGSFPFCPHGESRTSAHGDDIEGGQWFENGFKTPRKFYSHSEHERALAEAGLEIRTRNAGPDDKICRRWDAPDAVTLSNAAILLTRGAQAVRERNERWPQASLPITVTDLETGVKARDLD